MITKAYRKTRYLFLILGLLPAVLMGGCYLNSSFPKSEVDVCSGVRGRYVSQEESGIGVTSVSCAESSRGEWIEGRCYCHPE